MTYLIPIPEKFGGDQCKIGVNTKLCIYTGKSLDFLLSFSSPILVDSLQNSGSRKYDSLYKRFESTI